MVKCIEISFTLYINLASWTSPSSLTNFSNRWVTLASPYTVPAWASRQLAKHFAFASGSQGNTCFSFPPLSRGSLPTPSRSGLAVRLEAYFESRTVVDTMGGAHWCCWASCVWGIPMGRAYYPAAWVLGWTPVFEFALHREPRSRATHHPATPVNLGTREHGWP